MKTRKTNAVKPLRSRDVPATAAMLYEMEERLNHRMDSGFKKVDSRFAQIDSRFSRIDSRFAQIDARFAEIDSKLHDLKSEMHRIALLTEEQNARNKYVMDGYAQIYELLANTALRRS